MKSAYGVSIPEGLGEICNPNLSALIVYDMQAGIVPQIAEGPQVVAACARLLAAARKANMRVFYTRHMFLPESRGWGGPIAPSDGLAKKERSYRNHTVDASGKRFLADRVELAPIAGEVILDKITMSAFESTFFNLALRDAQLEAFIIAGIALEVGIEPTVRHGADLTSSL
jgi:biuret amidohydrolase